MTDWEGRYQANDMPWEKGKAAPPLLEVLDKVEAGTWGQGPILVPGCGLGHDVRTLAGGLALPVLGLDISPTAVERAGEFEAAGKESYELGDFLEPAWPQGRVFSAIWEHTCFCAIDPSLRPAYAEAVARCMVPGGLLAGVFFLTPNDPGEEDQGPPFNATVEELETRFAPWFSLIEGWVPSASYPGREGREWIGLFRRH